MIPSATRRKKGFPSILCNATADIMTKTFFQTKKEGEADSLQTSLQWTFVTGVRLLVTNLTDRHIYIDPQADIVGSHPHLTSATLIYGSIPASECDVIPMAFIQVFLCSSLCVSPYNPPHDCVFFYVCVWLCTDLVNKWDHMIGQTDTEDCFGPVLSACVAFTVKETEVLELTWALGMLLCMCQYEEESKGRII